jgi:hypothetical protein
MGSGGMINIPNFMTSEWGIKVKLRFCLINLRGCNVGITDGRNLRSMLLRWDQVSWYTHQVSYSLVQAFKVIRGETQAHMQNDEVVNRI